MRVDNLVIGAGIAGITLARRIAEEKGESVLIVEKRNHIGGYCYDYRSKEGILIHKYGPHIFRTEKADIYHFLSRFTDWYDYQHKVLTYVEGQYYPMPINLDTINQYLNKNFSSEEVLDYFEKVRIPCNSPGNVEEVIESQVGREFYEKFFKKYTEKQWGASPDMLPPEIVARIPIRTNRDDRYFTCKYQGVPADGYTAMMQNMLEHKRISVLLNYNFYEHRDEIEAKNLYCSAPIDEFFEYKFGKLPYRCVSFQFERHDMKYYQPVSVVNYPNEFDYTRITEFKHFTKHTSDTTVIAKEIPSDKGEPSYPIPIKENLELYEQYGELAQERKIHFIGRLGTYRYYSMDQIIENVQTMPM
ncbi:MAG: UDP-galactopyranose mutase [Lachnospiraceae bacterium]|nr:UDP-galactopyranose mutase [Lachnospiraceae bacterium]